MNWMYQLTQKTIVIPAATTKVKDNLKGCLETSKTGSHCQRQREENDLDYSRYGRGAPKRAKNCIERT